MRKSEKLFNILLSLPEYERNIVVESLSEKTTDRLNRNLYVLHEGPVTDALKNVEAAADREAYAGQRRYGRGGAAAGAAVGAGGALVAYALKQKKLKEKLERCNELSGAEATACKEKVKTEMSNLKKKMLAAGLGATLAGAGAGYGAGRLAHKRTDDYKNLQNYLKLKRGALASGQAIDNALSQGSDALSQGSEALSGVWGKLTGKK